MTAASAPGDDVEIVPKKTGVSLRRNKQFALVEAVCASRVRLGLQVKGHETTERLRTGAMC